jgi:hypothetical protein
MSGVQLVAYSVSNRVLSRDKSGQGLKITTRLHLLSLTQENAVDQHCMVRISCHSQRR